MNKQLNVRQQRRSVARSMTLVACGGIVGVIAIAAIALWFNWQSVTPQNTATAVDPMSMVG